MNDTTLMDLIAASNKKVSDEIVMRADYFREVDNILTGYPYVESICFYNSNDVALIAEKKRNIILCEEDSKGLFYENQLSERITESERGMKWYGGYQSTDFSIPLSKYEEPVNYITTCRPIYWSAHKAWIVMNVNLSYFTEIYNSQEKTNVQPEKVYILDGTGRIISHPEESEIGKKKGQEFQKESAADKDFCDHYTGGNASYPGEAYVQLIDEGKMNVAEPEILAAYIMESAPEEYSRIFAKADEYFQANIAKIITCEDEEAFNAQKEQMISDVMNMGYEEALAEKVPDTFLCLEPFLVVSQ